MSDILQFGEGNFLRSFIEYKLQKAINDGRSHSKVTVVIPRKNDKAQFFRARNNHYHVVINGIKNGAVYDETLFVEVIDDTVSPYYDFELYCKAYMDEELKAVISNTTEAGITFDEKDTLENAIEGTFPAKVTALLYDRFKAYGSKGGLIFLPCELIENNGKALKETVLAYAELWKLEKAFSEFIEKDNVFADTLVDRIVSGFPKGNEKAYFAKIGVEDPLLTVAEPYFFWAIAADSGIAEILPFLKDEEIVFTDELNKYRERKVRILNGLHTATTPLALLAGIDTVGEAVNEDTFVSFMESAAENEILPFIDLPTLEKKSFLAAVMERFKNPFVHHAFRSIALNSVSKWNTRVFPSVRDYLDDKNAVPKRLMLSLSALFVLYAKFPDSINDSDNVKEFFLANRENETDSYAVSFLYNFFPQLKEYPEAVSQYVEGVDMLLKVSPKEALRSL